MIIACLDDEEGIQKKGPDRDWLRRRAGRGSYTGIVTELAAEDLPSFKHYMRMDVNSLSRLAEVTSPRIVKRNTIKPSPISPSVHVVLMTHIPETRPFLIQRNQHFDLFIFPIPFSSLTFYYSVTCFNFFTVSHFNCYQYAHRC